MRMLPPQNTESAEEQECAEESVLVHSTAPEIPENLAPRLNPWFSIWLHPSDTFRQTRHGRHITALLLFILGCFSISLASDKISDFDSPFTVADYVYTTCLFTPFAGVAGFYLLSFFTWLLSRRSCKAKWREIATVFGWSYLPSIWLLPVSLAVLLALGPENYLLDLALNAPTSQLLPKLFKFLQLMIVYVMTTVLQTIGLKEILCSSYKRAFFTLIGASLLSCVTILVPCYYFDAIPF